MKKNQQGFSAVELVLAIVVLGLLVAVGWLVYDRQNTSDTKSNDETTENSEVQTDQAVEEVQPSYTLPEGWSETACDSVDVKNMLASPNNDIALNCDDSTNIIFVTMHESGKETCMSESEVEEVAKNKPISDYQCEEITVDGVKVIKELGDYGGGFTLSYSFSGKPLIISYFPDENGKLVNADAADALVKSVKF